MPERTEIRSWLNAEWVKQLRQVLESMTGETPEVGPAPPDIPEQAITIGWEHALDAGPECVFWTGAAESAWKQIGAKIMGGAGVEDSGADELRGTYLEVLSQVNSATAQAAGNRAGREISTLEGREVRIAPQGTSRVALEVRFAGSDPIHLHLAIGSGLERLIAAAENPPAQLSVAPAAPVHGSKTLDLLLEVELPVSVSFGRAQLQLKDVLKLTTGSIVELNRSIIEPVEIIVNNCVIARGEVVVLDGNYGVRITQVISRQERLRTLN
jgi:flagellar motor switch protein FliN/FliY